MTFSRRVPLQRALLATLAFAQALAGSALAGGVPVTMGSVRSNCATHDESDSVLSFLHDYESTLASGRVERIAVLYVELEPARRARMQDHFDSVIRDLRVHLDDIRVSVDGEFADVAFDRTDRFRDRESGVEVQKTVALARRLVRQGAGWQILLKSQ